MINYCFAFDVDRPRGDWLSSPGGEELLIKKLKFTKKASKLFDKYNIKRTLFLCGAFVEGVLSKHKGDLLKQSFGNLQNIEIGNHTYSHSLLKKLHSRTTNDRIISAFELGAELNATNEIIKKVFLPEEVFIFMNSFRSPYGYPESILKEPDILKIFLNSNFKYISSELRDKNAELYSDISEANLRLPYFIEDSTILEIPTHGWQDSAFTLSDSTSGCDKAPKSEHEIIEYYKEEFEKINRIKLKKNLPFFNYVLTLHFFDMMQYDPNLEILLKLITQILPSYGGKSLFYSEIFQED